MKKSNDRIKKYSKAAAQLSSLSDKSIAELLGKSEPMHAGIGGKSVLLTLDEINIFVKKVPLTDLERKPENILSTTNVFDLPLCYQYGIGSTGFGVWRELKAHIMTTNWVISGECSHFPLMYHWRVLPSQPNEQNMEYYIDLEKHTQYWENSTPIHNRYEAIYNSSAYIALFLEYIPHNVYEWLKVKIQDGGNITECALNFVDENLQKTVQFMNSHDFIHFDAHFKNILTDGELIYFSDFGLASSTGFELTNMELDFLKNHHNYDLCSISVNFIHCIITSLSNKNPWIIQMQEYLNNNNKNLHPIIIYFIKRYGSLALEMNNFYQKLQNETKIAQYPASTLDLIFKNVSNS
jgi:hypothetical protein